MAGPSRRKRTHKGIGKDKLIRSGFRREKAIDQVHEELSKQATVDKLKNQPVDVDLPGLGQIYCLECARHFMSESHLQEHRRGKLHKKRVKLLKEVPYSLQEAEAAGGLAPADNGKGRKSLLAPPGPILPLHDGDVSVQAE